MKRKYDKNMNRVTKESIEKKIMGVHYTKLGDKTTHCRIVLENGFEVTGESSCVDPKNYDGSIGQRISYENALRKIWELEGYLLQEKMHTKTLDTFETKTTKP